MRERRSGNFLWLCAFALGHVAFDGITVYTVNHLETVPSFLNQAAHILFYLFGMLFSIELVRYIISLLRSSEPCGGRQTVRLALIYFVLSVVYCVAFYFIPISYTSGAYTNYSSGTAATLAFAFPFVIFEAILFVLLIMHRKFDRHVLLPLVPMLFLMLGVAILEFFYTEILITGGCVTLVTLGVYFSFENPFLTRALDRAKAADRAKSEFLASMSHEIRTPLNAVTGFAELLKKDDLTAAERLEYLNGITTGGAALLSLINNVLDLSKLEAGQMIFNPASCDLRAVAEEIKNIFKAKVIEKGIEFKLELPEYIPYVYMDLLRVRQVLYNLAGNAVKFTSKGAVTFSVSHKMTSDDTCTLVMKVRDTGCGIAREDQNSIFQMFIQATHHRSSLAARDGAGTGLGLSISKRLVESMNGSISLESEPGCGSEFTVEFRDVKICTSYSNPRDTASVLLPGASGEKLTTVLLVDDIPLNLKVLSAMLEKCSCKVNCVQSAREALQFLDAESVELLLTDLWMPEMNGGELAAAVRGNPKWSSIRMALITADAECKENFDVSVFDEILTKPVTMKKLHSLLSRMKSGEVGQKRPDVQTKE